MGTLDYDRLILQVPQVKHVFMSAACVCIGGYLDALRVSMHRSRGLSHQALRKLQKPAPMVTVSV